MDLTSWEWNKISKDFKAQGTGRWLTNNNRAEQMTDKQINRLAETKKTWLLYQQINWLTDQTDWPK